MPSHTPAPNKKQADEVWRSARIAPFMLFVSVVLSLLLPVDGTGLLPIIVITSKGTAILAICILVSHIEEHLFNRFRHHQNLTRLAMAMATPIAALILGIVTVYMAGVPMRAIGDGSTTLLAIVCGTLWAVSAGLGTLMVLVLEGLIRPFTTEFRSRMNMAVLSLVSMAAVFAYSAAHMGQSLMMLPTEASTSMFHIDLGFGPVWAWDSSAMLILSDSTEVIAQTYFAFLVLITMPAVMSACGKLSDSLMTHLDPIRAGLKAVSRGELDFRITETGTKDFAKLNHTFNQMLQSLGLAKRMERAFGSYVSEEILDQIRNQHGEVDLEPSLRMATVFFVDIRGFTSMSERINPKQLLAVLNRFYEEVATVVQKHKGFLVQYIGDAVVVVFNGPIEQSNHADLAVSCAIDIQQAVTALNHQNLFPEAGDLQIGIGIASGPLVAGNLGDSRHLLQYTVLGDTVNQAARLTGLVPPGAVYVNQRNAEMSDPRHDPLPLKPVKVKGRARKLVPHQVWPMQDYTDVTEVHSLPIRDVPPAEA